MIRMTSPKIVARTPEQLLRQCSRDRFAFLCEMFRSLRFFALLSLLAVAPVAHKNGETGVEISKGLGAKLEATVLGSQYISHQYNDTQKLAPEILTPKASEAKIILNVGPQYISPQHIGIILGLFPKYFRPVFRWF